MKRDLKYFNSILESLQIEEEKVPVLSPQSPEQWYESIPLRLDEEGLQDREVYEALQRLLLATPRTGTRDFYNQLFGGRNAKALVADMLASYMNNSMYTFKVGGPQILMEQEVIEQLCTLVGYGQGSGGTMAPGGSMTNFMGMLMARDRAINAVHSEGVTTKMTMYASESAHYSLPKNASFMGIGRKQLRKVPTTNTGQMDTAVLKEMVARDKDLGYTPFLIVATAGTTVLGVFDDIEACADICDQHQMWLHVDGAYGGAVMFSSILKDLIKGSHRADSFSFNAHKMMGVPLASSFIMVRDKKYLYASFSNEAEYLYQTDGDDLNPGKISLQCGRRNDALKFWTLWKSLGTRGLAEMVEKKFALAQSARDYVRQNSDYTLYSNQTSPNICFNYKNIDPTRLCNALYEQGELMVGYGQFKDDVFVRLVSVNSNVEREDFDRFFRKLEVFAEKNKEELRG